MYLLICMITSLALVATGGNAFLFCTGKEQAPNINFTLYNRDNAEQGILLNEESLEEVDPENSTTMIIHGWNQNSLTKWVTQMKDVYLNKSADNIIILDWSAYAGGLDYLESVCYVKPVGIATGNLISNLSNIGIDVKNFQINGMSLGAHVAGVAGQLVYSLKKSKIGRINGLDAAGPEFVGAPISDRLDATDADFVQAIHTNGGEMGYAPNYGTIDFQVNFVAAVCGSIQNGCPENPGIPVEPGTILPYLMCNHVRSVAYYTESINSDRFIGKKCANCINFGYACKNPTIKTIMGENCPRNETGERFLNVNGNSPFAQG